MLVNSPGLRLKAHLAAPAQIREGQRGIEPEPGRHHRKLEPGFGFDLSIFERKELHQLFFGPLRALPGNNYVKYLEHAHDAQLRCSHSMISPSFPTRGR
jgi:hypothetical protein